METVLGKSCALEGKYGDATPFTSSSVYDENSKKTVAEKICDDLGMHGYQKHGNEMLYNGMTGEPMGMFFIGPVYYQRLKHLVSDKIHSRATGPVTTLTRQPLEGLVSLYIHWSTFKNHLKICFFILNEGAICKFPDSRIFRKI